MKVYLIVKGETGWLRVAMTPQVGLIMVSKFSSTREIFALPVADKVLIYAPLLDLTALVNRAAADRLHAGLNGKESVKSPRLFSLLEELRSPGMDLPRPRQGELGAPLFLGLVTTRGCNMSCAYCDFAAPKHDSPVMDLPTARAAIDAYLQLLVEKGQRHAELHFFGGEPFFAPRTAQFAVEYALAKAAEKKINLRLEAITNGFYSKRMAEWVASAFDTVFLSLDGPQDIQDRYRPAVNGRGSYEIVASNARLFAERDVELILRSCVTSDTVGRMAEIATWFAVEFAPSAVCFETIVPSALSRANGIEPPDPWQFVLGFNQAAGILASRGIETVLSTAEMGVPHVSFCPVGKDAMIVTPDGAIHACYLLEEEWRREGLDLTYGRLDPGGVGEGFLHVNLDSVERIRQLNVHSYPLCADCFCRFHCAGGCHVNRRKTLLSKEYDSTCIQTRMVFTSMLLKRMGQELTNQQWLADPGLYQATVLQKGDRL